jgi:hypothetical protein
MPSAIAKVWKIWKGMPRDRQLAIICESAGAHVGLPGQLVQRGEPWHPRLPLARLCAMRLSYELMGASTLAADFNTDKMRVMGTVRPRLAALYRADLDAVLDDVARRSKAAARRVYTLSLEG